MISREKLIEELNCINLPVGNEIVDKIFSVIENMPSVPPEQRYTKEELQVFKHGISLKLLSKRSAQHWQYDEDTATEIEFLERLYEKVGAEMSHDD